MVPWGASPATSSSRVGGDRDAQAHHPLPGLHHLGVGRRGDRGTAGEADLDASVAGCRPGLLEGAREPLTAGRDDHHVVAQLLDELELVGGEDDRGAGGGALAQHAAHVRDADGVEAVERLVEDEQLGVVDQRGRELDPLLVAVRQVAEPRPAPVRQTERPEPAVRGRGASSVAMPWSSAR
jgi:hypothetical protein